MRRASIKCDKPWRGTVAAVFFLPAVKYSDAQSRVKIRSKEKWNPDGVVHQNAPRYTTAHFIHSSFLLKVCQNERAIVRTNKSHHG